MNFGSSCRWPTAPFTRWKSVANSHDASILRHDASCGSGRGRGMAAATPPNLPGRTSEDRAWPGCSSAQDPTCQSGGRLGDPRYGYRRLQRDSLSRALSRRSTLSSLPKADRTGFHPGRPFASQPVYRAAVPLTCLSIPAPSCLIFVVAESHFRLFLINPADIRL